MSQMKARLAPAKCCMTLSVLLLVLMLGDDGSSVTLPSEDGVDQ